MFTNVRTREGEFCGVGCVEFVPAAVAVFELNDTRSAVVGIKTRGKSNTEPRVKERELTAKMASLIISLYGGCSAGADFFAAEALEADALGAISTGDGEKELRKQKEGGKSGRRDLSGTVGAGR